MPDAGLSFFANVPKGEPTSRPAVPEHWTRMAVVPGLELHVRPDFVLTGTPQERDKLVEHLTSASERFDSYCEELDESGLGRETVQRIRPALEWTYIYAVHKVAYLADRARRVSWCTVAEELEKTMTQCNKEIQGLPDHCLPRGQAAVRVISSHTVEFTHPFEAHTFASILPSIQPTYRRRSKHLTARRKDRTELLCHVNCVRGCIQQVLKGASQEHPLHLIGDIVAVRVRPVVAGYGILPAAPVRRVGAL